MTSSVYRLTGVGKDGAPVVAKRAARERIRVEAQVYQEILPALPLNALHCYGSTDDGDAGWLFLEDAAGERYREEDPEHRALASAWLGVLHASTSRMDLAPHVHARGLEPYYHRLRLVCSTVGEYLAHPELDRAAVAVLERIVAHCGVVESHWDEIERFWAALPCCLTHGDFISKNVRVRRAGSGLALYVLDWEAAGSSAPILDAAGLDAAVYWSQVREQWPLLSLPTVERLVNLGAVLRYLFWVAATCPGLADVWVERTVLRLTQYEARLAQALQTEGWVR